MAEREVAVVEKVAVQETEVLNKEVTEIERLSNGLMIRNDMDYSIAGEYTKQVKAMQKKITAYWKEPKESARAAHKLIVDREKEMLKPLDNSEKILKGKMSAYVAEKERERRRQEEELRRLHQEEVERKLREAAEAEKEGRSGDVQSAMMQAEMVEQAAANVYIPKVEPQAEGISKRKAWKIVGIDAAKVPVTFGGVEIRPVDERAVMALIKASKGNIEIPGVRFEETYIISARS